MQENGEVVCAIGSSLNIAHIQTFAQADVSLCLPPAAVTEVGAMLLRASGGLLTRGVQGAVVPWTEHAAAAVTGVTCALTANQPAVSAALLRPLVKLARHLVRMCGQTLAFLFASHTALILVMLLTTCILFPQIFAGYQARTP
jgi:hypothetical protein